MMKAGQFDNTHPNALLQLWLTGSHHTQSGLFLKPAFTVIIGDPGGDPKATGLWAGTPFSSLDQAVLSHQGRIGTIGLFLSVGCKHRSKHWIRKTFLITGHFCIMTRKNYIMILKKRQTYQVRESPWNCVCRESHTPTPRSTSLVLWLVWAWGSRGWAAWCPWSKEGHSQQLHPDRYTGICSCSGSSPHSCTPCLQTHR